jgi:type IV pilus assembly protein PilE
MTRTPRSRGFTLIELLITVAIVGILAAVAYPSYMNYVVRSNRSAAEGFMVGVGQREEQYLLDARQYAVITSNADFSTLLNVSVPAEVSKLYAVTVANVGGNPRTYLVTAAPIAGTMQANDGKLTLDNLGAKLPASKW